MVMENVYYLNRYKQRLVSNSHEFYVIHGKVTCA